MTQCNPVLAPFIRRWHKARGEERNSLEQALYFLTGNVEWLEREERIAATREGQGEFNF